jgi:hypothetical protein
MPWFSCVGAHVEAGELALALGRETGGAPRRRWGCRHLEDRVVGELLLDRGARAGRELVFLDGALDQLLDRPHVAASRAADLLVVVGVDQRADALVREDLGEQPVVHAAVDHVHARHAGLAGGHGVARLRRVGRVDRPARERVRELPDRQLPRELALDPEAVGGRDVDELDGGERLGDLERDRVRVDAEGLAGAVEPERRHHRNDAAREQRLQESRVDALDLAGEQMVDPPSGCRAGAR